MRIVVRVTTQGGHGGWLVYAPDGELIALIKHQPGPPWSLTTAVGPHVLLDAMLAITSQQWTRLVAYVPGGEGLCSPETRSATA